MRESYRTRTPSQQYNENTDTGVRLFTNSSTIYVNAVETYVCHVCKTYSLHMEEDHKQRLNG